MMNTAETNQQRRTIKVKDFLDDFHAGMNDTGLIAKYHLTEPGLDKFFSMLVERKIIGFEELALRSTAAVTPDAPAAGDKEEAGLLCPSCRGRIETEFDICPHCGVFVADPGASFSESHKAGPVSNPHEEESEPFFPWHSASNSGDASSERSGEFTRQGPIEIPLADLASGKFGNESEEVAERFKGAFSADKDRLEDDSADEVVPGMPLDVVSREPETPVHSATPHCRACDVPLRDAVRDVYDRRSGFKAALLSGGLFGAGLLGAIGLALCEGYSAFRLLLIYVTGLSMLGGACMGTLSVFMLFLAKEKVAVCDDCRRMYPRL